MRRSAAQAVHKRGSTHRFAITAVTLLCAGLGSARQALGRSDSQTQPASQSAAEPYWVCVTAESVKLRSRPDVNSIAVARLPYNAVLRAVGREFGWHRVVTPEGVFSYVAAANIERRSETEGVVATRSGALRVRAGSLVQDIDPQHSEVQALLERGTAVKIIGVQDEWLKIVPPAGVHVYVSAEYAEQVSDEVAARLGAMHTLTTQPTSGAAAGSTTRPAVHAASQPTEGPDLRGEWGQRLVEIEGAIQAEGRKPVADQDWSHALARLRPIAAQREEPMVAELATAWIRRIEERMADLETFRAADEVLRRAARERAQHEREMALLQRLQERGATQPSDAARGALLRSFAVGERDGKRWYKLQDPVTRRLETYLEIEPESDLNPEAYLGKYVGVRGPRRFEPELGADVVRVEAILDLAATQPATQPARGEP